MLRFSRNTNDGGVSCYIRSDIGNLQKYFFPKEIENISVEIPLSTIKSLINGIIYRHPNHSNFLEIINANFYKLPTIIKELHILGDFNKNMYQNSKYITHDDNTISSKFQNHQLYNA